MKTKQIPIEADFVDKIIIPGIYSKAALNGSMVYGGPNEAAALALRHVITAAPGNELVVADWKNVEGRIMAWIAGEIWKLDAYRAADAGTGKDTYKLLFSFFFGTPVDEVNDSERQGGKVVDLSMQFGGGVGALVTMAAGYQLDLNPMVDIVMPRATEVQKKKAYKAWRRAFLRAEDYDLEPKVYQACDILKQVYRESNAKIDQLKHDVEDAVKGSIKAPNVALYTVGRCRIWSTGSWLIIELPSGRRLLYAKPQLHREVESNADDPTAKPQIREVLSYVTARGKTWRRETAWSGLFIENMVQAIAADVLRHAMLRVHEDALTVPAVVAYLETLPEEERTPIALHVHDEIALDVPKGSYPIERLKKLMTAPFPWSDGLPLAAEGWTNFRYGKRKGK